MFVKNALIVKIKNIYGQRLKENDYNDLLKRRSVPEVAAFLKEHPGYSQVFAQVQIENIRRAQLEELVRVKTFNQIQRVTNFLKTKQNDFFEINIVQHEFQIILSLIRAFISYEEKDIVSTLPLFFDKRSELDFQKLAKTNNLEELVVALGNLRYGELLKPYKDVSNEDIRYTEIETVFDNAFYEYVKERINKSFKGKTRKELLDIFETKVELTNIIKIYRLKKFYRADNALIKTILTPQITRLSQNKIEQILEIDNPDEIFAYLAKSDLAKYTDGKDQVYLEYFADHIQYSLAKRNIAYSSSLAKVFLGFMVFLEIEAANVTHIIEGIRYKVSEDEIRQILVY